MSIRISGLSICLFVLLVVDAGLTSLRSVQSISFSSNHLCPNYELTESYVLRDENQIAQNLRETAALVGLRSGFGAYLAPRGVYPIGPETFGIEAGTSITIDFGVYYFSDQTDELDVRFLALLDEEQINIGETDSDMPYHDVVLRSEEPTLFAFMLPPLASGIYDLVVVGIPNIDTIPEHGDMTNIMSLTRRISLVVGDETIATGKERSFTPAPAAVLRNDFSGYYLFGFHLDDSRLWWSYPEPSLPVSAGSAFGFNVKTGYLGSPPTSNVERIALTLFVDYEQRSIDTENQVLFLEIGESTAYTQIPITLTAPEETGRHDILVLRITNPGVPRCIQLNTPEGTAHWYQAIGDRVSIDVQD